MKPILTFLAALLPVLLPSPLHAADAPNAPRPNIIFILADDLGWADLPVYGNRFNEAPNLTRLAARGMRFTDAYAAAPVCSPTRASIMSGQYPARVGIIDFIPGHWRPFEKVTVPSNRTQYLPTNIVTIAEALKTAGYATALFGKWHLGNQQEHHPSKQGFDEANVGQGYYNVRFDPAREDSKEKIMAERLADFGMDFIERNKAKPFFLFLSHWDVHVQFDAEQARIDKFLKKPAVAGYPCHAVYAAMIEQLDHSVGRVLDKLDALGLRDNTLVVFFSDNGGQISNDRYPGVTEAKMPLLLPARQDIYRGNPLAYIATANAPLRGEKGMLYEGGIREPLIVSWPGRIKPGSVCKTPVTSVDFYPTFLELAGAAIPEGQTLDGKSILPEVLTGAADPERAIYWHYPVYHHDVPASAVRQGQWKLVENLVTRNSELYNLQTDIGETTDLAGVFPEKAKELQSLLQQWRADVKAEFPKPNPAFDEKRRFEWGERPKSR
jgi:arylsulfatase A